MRNTDDTATQRVRAKRASNDNAPAPSHTVPRSWAPEVLVSGTWSGNALRFATKAEAERHGRLLLMRWFVPTDSRAVASEDAVNYALDADGSLVSVACEAAS